MEMDREQLESYRSKRDEIQELRYKLNHLDDDGSMIGHSTILNGNYYPPKPETVVGYDYEKSTRLRNRYTNCIAKLQKECEEIEEWIEQIPESLTRRIFRMVFIESMKQQQVAKKVHLSQSSISEKISNFLKSDKIDKKV